MVPNFFVIGAMKGGTSSLFRYLRSHPQIATSRLKEPQYFMEERSWNRGLTWYESLFPTEADGYIAVGEASVGYSRYPVFKGVPERIADCVPQARFIYVLREPVDRMRSHYLQELKRGFERLPIERALLENPIYMDASRYALQLERYLRCFPLERFCLVTSEDLRFMRQVALGRIYRFLGVDEAWRSPVTEKEYGVSRGGRGYRPAARRLYERLPLARSTPLWLRRWSGVVTSRRISPTEAEIPESVRAQLNQMLAEDVARLRTFLGADFDGWGIA